MKRLRLAQEKSCDEAVVRADNAAVSYADFLLQAAKHAHRSLFRPLALAVVPARQNALKQRLTNILTPTMKTKPSRRLSASLVVLVTAVCLTLATLGWRTSSIAHEVSDPDLQAKLEAEVLEAVELKSASVRDAIDYLKGQLLVMEVNIVLLRGAQQAQENDHREHAMLHLMINEQRDETEEARLKMLDLAERYRITPTSTEISVARLRQSDESMLAKEMAISKEKMRIEKLSGLDGGALMRFIGDELPSNPFLDSAVQGYVRAKAELEGLPLSGVTEASQVEMERKVSSQQQRMVEEIQAVRAVLKTKLEMAEHELALSKAIAESQKDSLMDERRKMAEYDASRRNYDRQLAALDDLEQRQLDARLNSAQTEEPRISLDLTNVSLADAMTYALQLAGLDYRLRKNTIVIGTPAELKAL